MTLHPAVATIYRRLEEQDLSFRWLSIKSGVDYNTLYRWKRGEASPRLDLLIAVLDALDVDLCPMPKPRRSA